MRRFIITVVAIGLIAGSATAQQNANLSESFVAKDCTRVEIRTKVDGERFYFQDGSKKTQSVKLEAGHRCIEKVMILNSTSGAPSKLVRMYDAARSSLAVGSDQPGAQTLRVDRAMIVAVRGDDSTTVYCPKGPLTREELELVGEHFDTTALAGLLPGKEVAVGTTWPIGNRTAITLCQFEALEHQSLTGKLDAVAGDQAKIIITGNAKGIDGGAQAVLTINATVTFDTTKRKIIAVEWKQDDQRDQGPVSPGFKATVTVNITRDIVAEPAELKDGSLEMIPAGTEIPAGMTAVVYRDQQNRFEITHPREWRMTSATEAHTTMRLVERGDMIAQANITMLDRTKPGNHMSASEFKEKMMASPGWQPGQVIEESEVKGRADRFIYRLSVAGSIDEKQIVQTFYLVASAGGAQAVIAFQSEQQKSAKITTRELLLVDGLELAPKR